METLTDSRIDKIVEAVNKSDISSIKSVVSGLISLINNPDSTAKELTELIVVDPPLSGKILKIANSAFYKSSSEIKEIERAIIWIGYGAVKELALRQKACEIFDSNDPIEGYMRSELWAYCVGVAMFSKLIYRREYGEKGENIYAIGLLHKIGLIAEEQFIRKAFIKMLQVHNKEQKDLIDIERKILGFDHAFLGGEVAQSWELPEEMVALIRYHLNPYEAPEEFFKPVATLYVSTVLCRFAEIGYFKATPFDDALYTRCIEDLGLDQESLNLIMEDGKYEIADMWEKGAM